MKKNLGGIERALRFVIGIVLASVGAFLRISPFWRAVFFAVAIVLLATVFAGICPLWSALGIDTCKDKKPH